MRRLFAVVLTLGVLTAACVEPTILESSDETIPVNLTALPATPSSSDAPPQQTDSEILWRECETKSPDVSQCARLEVPYDYDKPSVGSFSLFLKRKPAGDPTRRIGSLLVNPGGPGFGGTSIVTDANYYFSQDLLDRFDIVGWDPRGTGETTPAVDCIDEYDKYFGIDSPPETPEEKQAIIDASQEFNDRCAERSGEILPYISTRSTAQDMDSIRKALGEDKITYFGFSYGSELGATWATMFPDTVRAAVLDGASDPNSSSLDQGLAQAKGFEQQLDAFLEQCAKRVSCLFYSNGRPAAALDKLLADIDANPLPTSPGRIPVTQGVMYTALAQSMYADVFWPELERALADAIAGDGKGLLKLYDNYYQRKPDGTYGNELEAFIAISCLDDPGPIGVAAVDAEIPVFKKAAKRFGLSFAYGYSCALWPVAQAPRVTVTGKGAGPIIVIGTTGDAATPLESSRNAARALEGGVFLIVEADQHTGYGVNKCIVSAVDSYLLDLVVPDNEKVCN